MHKADAWSTSKRLTPPPDTVHADPYARYVRMDSLGWGTHGRVWLCREYDSETNSLGDAFAMKEVYREDQSRNLKKAQRAMHGTSFNHVADAAFQQTQQPVPPTSGRASDEVRENMYQSGSGIQTPERISLPRSHGRISDLAYATPQDAPTQPMKQKRGTLQMEEKVRQEIAIMKR